MIDPGLCGRCRHANVVTSDRGSRFHLCLRSRTDPRYPRYPRLPVLACPGFEPADDAAPAGADGGASGREVADHGGTDGAEGP